VDLNGDLILVFSNLLQISEYCGGSNFALKGKRPLKPQETGCINMLSAQTLLPKFLPSYLLLVMGTMDCVTTAMGVMFFGASEMNPFLTGIVSTSIPAFLVLKMSATAFIAATYFQAKKVLNAATDKTRKSYVYSNMMLKVVYAALVLFLVIVVANNLMILAA
jgi:hypothetical protein